MSGLAISRDCRADAPWLVSLSRGAATPETEVVVFETPSLADRAERVERLLLDLCLRADVGIILAPVPWYEDA